MDRKASLLTVVVLLVALICIIYIGTCIYNRSAPLTVVTLVNPTLTPVLTHITQPTPTPVATQVPKSTTSPIPISPTESSCISSICTYYGKKPPYSKSTGYDPIKLVENKSAVDPTWQYLKDFVDSDPTDTLPYILGSFMCGSFAEKLHNNAEALGIKSAYVHIEFLDTMDSHALNAFNTSDRGLVYIDCTGEGGRCSCDPSTGICSCKSTIKTITCEYEYTPYGRICHLVNPTSTPIPSYDKVDYVEIGRELGSIGIGSALDFSYRYYETQVASWDTYNIKVEAYNNQVASYSSLYDQCGGYADVGRYSQLTQWYSDLEVQEAQLDSEESGLADLWEPLGVVSAIEIYW